MLSTNKFYKNDINVINETVSQDINGVSNVEYNIPRLNPDSIQSGQYGSTILEKTIYVSALDDAVNFGKMIRFSHDPRNYGGSYLADEWKYLQEKYGFDELIREGDVWIAK